MLVTAGLVLITFVDLDEWIIPNEVTYPGVPIGLACSLVGMFFPASMLRVQDPIVALLGIALGGGVLYLLDKLALLLLKKRGMGFGDVKLLAMLGAFVGWQGVLGIVMLASLLGSVIGVAMLVMNKRHPLPENNEEEDGDEAVPVQGNYLPFGPYLALAGFIFILFGPEMIDLYIGFLTPSAPIPAVLPM
jgi:leader peptidase (prepilin peptidase)/N-methyltransferase